MDQIAIVLLGPTAIWLSQDARPQWRRWACVAGMLSQPFWFYTAWQAEQWGVFAVCFLYAASWIKGFWTNWIKRDGAV